MTFDIQEILNFFCYFLLDQIDLFVFNFLLFDICFSSIGYFFQFGNFVLFRTDMIGNSFLEFDCLGAKFIVT